ncbi:hypothetical protein CRP01_20345 [Flavilitoribacter nigricans DSM 23189 = NBRC 102662]|uniref:Uncharacterized protein n=1 Tax=Flavilitoribacter nigricans (strain ATCC 23147 / DSM 23189 / NBRC 102662 / NCIMB 1420 / SS-2) TaxID=1122177 RepID=A0A2D0N9P3_FLAN2|nr:hypothetical protein CRP01_20345 [Flavilitoribacter nigricans DSM 23189 = NBRC 102662]
MDIHRPETNWFVDISIIRRLVILLLRVSAFQLPKSITGAPLHVQRIVQEPDFPDPRKIFSRNNGL